MNPNRSKFRQFLLSVQNMSNECRRHHGFVHRVLLQNVFFFFQKSFFFSCFGRHIDYTELLYRLGPSQTKMMQL